MTERLESPCPAVVEGSAEVRRNGRKAPTKGGSESFGELELVSADPRNTTVIAVSPVKALVIRKPDVSALLRTAGHHA
jgi:CRP-like cAMP-binding protein